MTTLTVMRTAAAIVETLQREDATKCDLAVAVGRSPTVVQRALDWLREEFDAPIQFQRERQPGFWTMRARWEIPPMRLTRSGFVLAQKDRPAK